MTPMWRGSGTPQNFCLAFIDELEKQLFIKRTLKWANKKCKNFNIYNVFFQKKMKEISLFYTCVPKILMIWSTVLECDRLKLVNFGSFFAPHPLKHKNNTNIEKMTKLLKISSSCKCSKNHNHMKCSSWDTNWDRHKLLPL